MECPVNANEWIEEHKTEFCPPIGNKLMYRNDLSVMFVGGPNQRTDFHVDESSEFFFQLRGNMYLPIMERGKRRLVSIKQGQVFLLPSRVPHSPQRPEVGSIGLVIERKREIGKEFDCLRWYTNFETCEAVQYEQFFGCEDLGRDLVPVVQDYKRFMVDQDGQGFVEASKKPINDDPSVTVPAPFDLAEWIGAHEGEFQRGATVSLFGDNHPDKEFSVFVSSETGNKLRAATHEVFMYQLRGSVEVTNELDSKHHTMHHSACFVLPVGSAWTVTKRSDASLTLVLYCNPFGNK